VLLTLILQLLFDDYHFETLPHIHSFGLLRGSGNNGCCAGARSEGA
jgi:hypothetical protein